MKDPWCYMCEFSIAEQHQKSIHSFIISPDNDGDPMSCDDDILDPCPREGGNTIVGDVYVERMTPGGHSNACAVYSRMPLFENLLDQQSVDMSTLTYVAAREFERRDALNRWKKRRKLSAFGRSFLCLPG